MKFSPQVLAAALVTAAALALTSCSAPNGYSYNNIGITISVSCSDCGSLPISYNPNIQPANSVLYMPQGGGQGGVYQLTATVTNAPASNVTWQIFPTPNLTLPNPPPSGTSQPGVGGSQVGTFTTASNINNTTAVGPTVFYTNGGTPVYTDAALAQAQALGIPQGDVLIVASVPSDPSNPSATVSTRLLIQMYNASTTPTLYLSPSEPGTPSGLTVSVVQVARNTTFQFYGGAVGEQPCTTTPVCSIQGSNYPTYTADNSVVWSVGGTQATATPLCNAPPPATQPAAGCPYGWISSTGLYTAPPTVPTTPSGSGLANGQVVIVMASHFLPTITKFANITVY